VIKRPSLFAVALIVCAATCASAQQAASAAPGGSPQPAASAQPAASPQPAASDDTRTQYPAFLTNSYFAVNIGRMGNLFSEDQLEPGFQAQSVDIPRLAVRIDLFGHHITEHLSAQITYMRPAKYITYHDINGDASGSYQVSTAFAGLTLVGDVPVTARVSAYGEGGLGITSRSGFEIDKMVAVPTAHYTAGLLGAGLAFHATSNTDITLGATYSPGRKSFSQPSTRLFTVGIRHEMRPLPAAEVEENRDGGFVFPLNVARLGYTTNLLGYGVNDLFSGPIPIFWGGNVQTRRGFTLDYERNVFHTKERFAFDLGASASYWISNGQREIFRTVSAYPLFRFFLARTEPADVYFSYSLAGPTFLSTQVIDGRDTGAQFTFQDFMGVGGFLGKTRRINAEIGIKHYSNGNIFTTNAAIKVPLSLSLGVTF
jgi:opacity protein-like surface antigen